MLVPLTVLIWRTFQYQIFLIFFINGQKQSQIKTTTVLYGSIYAPHATTSPNRSKKNQNKSRTENGDLGGKRRCVTKCTICGVISTPLKIWGGFFGTFGGVCANPVIASPVSL